ncbi:MAG: lipoyl(octanoyl) transferase LipB [Sandaracinaceae bacterium]
MRRVTVYRLGQVDYAEAHELQNQLNRARQRKAIGDALLLLEHPPTVTLGRAAKEANLLLSRPALEARGFTVHDIGRGGDVTYHGPGQVVGYPILDLNPDRRDVRRYVGDLEETMIRTASTFGVRAGRVDKLNGAWVQDRKIGAVGVRISRWVTMHGFALNVSTDLSHFGVMVPCGIVGKDVTSLERELGEPVLQEDVLAAIESHFAEIFEAELVRPDAAPLSGVAPESYAPEAWRG